MSERSALFLAVGGNRRRGVVEAANRVVGAGGRASVVLGDPAVWQRETFDPRVELVALWPVERRRLPVRIEQGLLYTAPAFGLRLVGAGRAAEAYRHRVADRVHRRLALPALRSVFGDARHRLLHQHVLAGPALDVLIIADAPSMPLAQRLLQSGVRVPELSFNVADALPV